MPESWEGCKGRIFIGFCTYLCHIQPRQCQTRTPWRAVCCWGYYRDCGEEMPLLFSWREFDPFSPYCSANLSVKQKELLSFLSPHSTASNSAARRSNRISSCKAAVPCFKKPCLPHHTAQLLWLGNDMELHRIRYSTIKMDQNALVNTGNLKPEVQATEQLLPLLPRYTLSCALTAWVWP